MRYRQISYKVITCWWEAEMRKESQKRLRMKVKAMRVSFLRGAIKKKAFSFYTLGDFKQKLKKLQKYP
jgi:hypothetical protein